MFRKSILEDNNFLDLSSSNGSTNNSYLSFLTTESFKENNFNNKLLNNSNYSKKKLINSSIITKKPNKKKGNFCFPNYLNKKDLNKIELKLKKINKIEFISTNLKGNPIKSFKIIKENILNDKRRTCMIKNIPNKYNSNMLINFINETHFGMYDFFYLRMDFKNKCNVGYAFINFINKESVLRFYERINGKKWNNFTSNKIAELTYASIQGIENLKAKFKNSLVMQENKDFRPKTFYTNGKKKGMEREEF